MKHLFTTLAVIAIACTAVAAQCPSQCDAKVKSCDAKLVKVQDEKSCQSSCGSEAKLVKAQDEKSCGSCPSSCSTDADAMQRVFADGCCTTDLAPPGGGRTVTTAEFGDKVVAALEGSA